MNELKKGYKMTELGMIPEDWEVKQLGEMVTFQRGFDLPARHRKRSGSIPVVSSAGVTDFHDEAKHQSVGVVTGRYGTIGKVFFMQEPFWPLNTTLYIKDFHNNSPKFIFHLLETFDFHVFSGKSGVPGINRNDLHSEKVLLPPLPEQRAIATALSDVDALIAALEAVLTKKRQIKQAMMQELLTGKRRLAGFTGTWENVKVGDVLDICHGKNQKNVEVPLGKYPILATGGEIGRSNQFLYDKPSVLIGRKGTIDKPQYMSSPFWTVDTLFYSKIKDDANAKFIYFNFLLIDWMNYNEASGVPSLNARTIESITIPLPPLPEQRTIAAILSDLDAEISALEARITKTRTLKQGMMQELLTGKTRLV